MHECEEIYNLWGQKQYVKALVQAWRLPRSYRYPSLHRGDMDLRGLVFEGCRAMVQRASQEGLAQIEELLTAFPPPPALVDHYDSKEDAEWCKAYRQAMIQAHLLCARAILTKVQWTSCPVPPGDLDAIAREIADETDFPVGLLCDLIQELLPVKLGGGSSRWAPSKAELIVLLVDAHPHGDGCAKLVLERVAGGQGALYPATTMAFVPRNCEWCGAERKAYDSVRRLGLESDYAEVDVRWCLMESGKPLQSHILKGASIGAAFALGLSKILAEGKNSSRILRRLSELALSHVAVTAVIENGSMRHIEMLSVKLHATPLAKSLYGLDTILVAEEQRLEIQNAYPHLLKENPYALHVVCASNLNEAIESLVQWQRKLSAAQTQYDTLENGQGMSDVTLTTPAPPAHESLEKERKYLEDLKVELERIGQQWMMSISGQYRKKERQGPRLLRYNTQDYADNPALSDSELSVRAGFGRRVKVKNLAKELRKFSKIVVLGEPGSGKSVCLRQLAYDLAMRGLSENGHPKTLPLFVEMGAYEGWADKHARRPASVLAYIVQQLRRHESIEESPTTNSRLYIAAHLEKLLAAGRVTCIFDALDEMPQDSYQERYQAIKKFMATWEARGNRFVYSCRTLDYDPAFNVDEVLVDPFDLRRIRTFLDRYVPEVAEVLYQSIIDDETLEEIVSNPFFLQAFAYSNAGNRDTLRLSKNTL